MTQAFESTRVWTKVVGSAAIGAAAMFVLDPDKGRRRRALARDKMRRIARRTGEVVDGAARDFTGRWQGVRAKATRRFAAPTTPDDAVLRERVRACLGRLVSHPHALQVQAAQGCVTLAGPILVDEVAALLEAVQSVPGVTSVDNQLDPHRSAEGILALQGDAPRRRQSELLRDNWTPAQRVGAVAGGGILALCGISRGGVTGLLMTLAGVGLAVRGSTNQPLGRLGESLARARGGAASTRDIGAETSGPAMAGLADA